MHQKVQVTQTGWVQQVPTAKHALHRGGHSFPIGFIQSLYRPTKKQHVHFKNAPQRIRHIPDHKTNEVFLTSSMGLSILRSSCLSLMK